MTEDTVPMERLAKVYRKIRAAKGELNKHLDDLDEQLKEVANAMKDMMLAQGVKGVKTDAGTVTLMLKTRYDARDWDAYKKFILETQQIDLVERRIAQGNMSKYLAANPGVVPPGMDVVSEYAVSVRKPTDKE